MSTNSENGAEDLDGYNPQLTDKYERRPLRGMRDAAEAILIFTGEDGTFWMGR